LPPDLPSILHHGAVDGVTGSCHELLIDEDHSVLVDCGLFQGAETAEGATATKLEIGFDVSRVRALLVTHAHLDHIGRIPYLLAAGFRGPIYCSEPTAALLPLMMQDALQVGFTRDARLIERFLGLLESLLVPVPYRTWLDVPLPGAPDGRLAVRFQRAGHILGSAYIECALRRAPHGPATRVVFSGDLGAPHTPLLPAPRPPYAADVLVIEATYGDRLHEGRRTRRERLRAVIERCFANRGAVLIPAFSLGRTQELLYELETIIHRHGRRPAAAGLAWEDLEVVLDSPLAGRLTHQHRALQRFWDGEAHRRLAAGRRPLGFDQLTTIESHQAHLNAVAHLQRTARPTVVVAGSGMCTGGRIVDYLKALLGDPRTAVLFVGYQAEGTPGRAIQRYGPRGGYVELDGTRYPIRASVHTLGGYSGHADRKDLVNFVRHMRVKPREIRIVHGDAAAKTALQSELENLLPQARSLIPDSRSAAALSDRLAGP
jgi:metallo-beta-lactamase family protein